MNGIAAQAPIHPGALLHDPPEVRDSGTFDIAAAGLETAGLTSFARFEEWAAPGAAGGAAAPGLEPAVRTSCARFEEWPARVAAGVAAALDYAAENPAAARALRVDSRAGEPGEADAYLGMIARFAAMLGADAPRVGRLPAS